MLEEEIKRIAHAVHDDAGQLLFAVHLALAEFTAVLPKPQRERVLEIEELLKQVENRLRHYSHELRPTMLDDLGWLAAIRFLANNVCKRSGIRVHIETRITHRLESALEITLYRIVQEALNNVTKHSKAANVHIKVVHDHAVLCCSISDDGVGFNSRTTPTNTYKRGLWFLGMRERLNAIGGTLTIESAHGRGTNLWIRFPLETKDGDSHRSR
jgi:signal transduction histidine kinase